MEYITDYNRLNDQQKSGLKTKAEKLYKELRKQKETRGILFTSWIDLDSLEHDAWAEMVWEMMDWE